METKKKTLWVVLAAVLAIWLAVIAFYGDVLIMYIAPQAALGDAFRQTCTNLQAYYDETPLPILLKGYDPEGKQDVHIVVQSAGGPKGDIHLQTDLKSNQILLEGALPDEPKLGNISLYLSRDCAALTSGALLGGGYYGITYETFPEDLRSIPLVSLLVSEKLIAQWEDEVKALQKKMDFHLELPQIREIDLEPLKIAPTALWAFRGRVCAVSLEQDGQMLPCYKVTYCVEGETARRLWEIISQDPFPEGSHISLTCWLHQNVLVRIHLNAQVGPEQISCVLTQSVDQKAFSVELSASGTAIAMSTQKEGQWRSDVLQAGGGVYAYQWNKDTGDLKLSLPEKPPVSMNLTEAENGFRVESAELDKLISSKFLKGHTCTATVTKGRAITQPEFKNLSTWSLEDLLIFLNGVWTVIKPQ